MKRIVSAFLLSVVLAFSLIIPASAANITAEESGFVNIYFSNGYYGFCIDRYLHGATTGDGFTVAENTSVANNNIDNNDISQLLKALFTQCFEDIFISDGIGGYIIDPAKESNVSYAIYHFTGEQDYIWGDIKTYVNKVKAYSGSEIPDEGYSIKLDNGDIVTFYFAVFEPQKEDQQSFFAYKLEISQEEPHEHDYSDDWESDDEKHWHECECGDTTDEGKHTYVNGSCTSCGKKESITENNTDDDSDSDNGLNIDFDSLDISGLVSIFDSLDISGIISDSENATDKDTATDTDGNASTDENVNQEIPDTGSGTDIAFAYAALLLGVFSLIIVFIRKKKHIG